MSKLQGMKTWFLETLVGSFSFLLGPLPRACLSACLPAYLPTTNTARYDPNQSGHPPPHNPNPPTNTIPIKPPQIHQPNPLGLELADGRRLGPLQGRLVPEELADVGDAVFDHGGPLQREPPGNDAHALGEWSWVGGLGRMGWRTLLVNRGGV